MMDESEGQLLGNCLDGLLSLNKMGLGSSSHFLECLTALLWKLWKLQNHIPIYVPKANPWLQDITSESIPDVFTTLEWTSDDLRIVLSFPWLLKSIWWQTGSSGGWMESLTGLKMWPLDSYSSSIFHFILQQKVWWPQHTSRYVRVAIWAISHLLVICTGVFFIVKEPMMITECLAQKLMIATINLKRFAVPAEQHCLLGGSINTQMLALESCTVSFKKTNMKMLLAFSWIF